MATASTSRTVRTGVERLSFAGEDGKILPKKGERNILITSALPYVNNQPHLGNIIGSTLSADCYARYCRTRNWRTLYVCGTDQYGTASETQAIAEGITPRELCDKFHAKHVEAYNWFQLGFDYFGQTSTEQHTEICQDIFKRLLENGFLVEKSVEQYYCEKDKRFLADRFVEGTCPKCGFDDARGDQCDKVCQTIGSYLQSIECRAQCSNPLDALELINPRCKLCSSTPVPRLSQHYYIKLEDLEAEVLAWYQKAKGKGVWSKNAMQLTEGWFKMGLQQRCMTRDLTWGVPVPVSGWEDKVLYVWFDAPIGYPSITANYTDRWREWWKDPENVRLVQFMGKDNTPFHAIFFPSYLIGTREPWAMLHSLSTTEYLQYEDAKFSKSRGIGVFGDNAKETGIPPAVWRYYLLANRPETSDSEFNWRTFIEACNSKLVDTLGNFINRVAKFVDKNYDGVVPSGGVEAWTESEKRLAAEVDGLLDDYVRHMDGLELRAGLADVMIIANRGNEYLQRQRLDNNLFTNHPETCALTCLTALNLVYLLSALIHPFMPSTDADICKILGDVPPRALPSPSSPAGGFAQNPGSGFTIDLLPGHRLGKPFHLFSKIDPAKEDVWRKQFGGKQQTAADAAATTTNGKAAAGGAASKKAAAKAAKLAKSTPAYTGPKTDEMLELEKRVAEQGQKVRELKAAGGEGVADQVKALQALKAQLDALVDKYRVQTTVSQE